MNKGDILASLDSYGLIQANGPDSEKFLEGQLSCAIKSLGHQQSTLGAHCNIKGRISALFRIFRIEDNFYLRLPKSLLPQALANLKKYARFSKVNLIEKNLSNLSPLGLLKTKDSVFKFPYPQKINEVTVFGNHVLISVPAPAGYERLEIYLNLLSQSKESEESNPLTPLLQKLEPTDALVTFFKAAPKFPFPDWLALDIQQQIPEIWPETSEAFLPAYIGLLDIGAVSLNKGCYLGQEIIARMAYRAKELKYETQIAQVDGDSLLPFLEGKQNIPKPGDTWHHFEKETQIISAALTSQEPRRLILLLESPV